MTSRHTLQARTFLPGLAVKPPLPKVLGGRMGAASLSFCQHTSSNSSRLSGKESARMTSSHMLCPAYVGQDNPLAGQYHSQDYNWHEHAQQTAELVERQWTAAPAAIRQAAKLDASGQILSAVSAFLSEIQCSCGWMDGIRGSGSQPCTSSNNVQIRTSIQQGGTGLQLCIHEVHSKTHRSNIGSSSSSSSQHRIQQQQAVLKERQQIAQQASENEWEVFYRAHPSARFYKERRYLLLEFPCLAPPSNLQHVVEIGAGCGSSLLPVLRAQPHARATVCDVSSTCLQQLQDAMQLLRLSPERCTSFVADGTDPALAQQLAGCAADAALIMFTLSAVPPKGMLRMIQNARASLRPGGVLCIRDHALYDMVQLRIPPEQCIGRHLYRRGDDTLAYFFTIEELSGLATAAGLEVVECEYVCVFNRNRKTGQELRRAFVHGMFRRP